MAKKKAEEGYTRDQVIESANNVMCVLEELARIKKSFSETTRIYDDKDALLPGTASLPDAYSKASSSIESYRSEIIEKYKDKIGEMLDTF